MSESKFIAVDFDGTMVVDRFPEIGEDNPYAIDVVKRFIRDGHYVILNTYRQGKHLNEAVEYLRNKGITFYAINENTWAMEHWGGKDCKKVYADIYIDDHCIFTKKVKSTGAVDWKYIKRNYKKIMGT